MTDQRPTVLVLLGCFNEAERVNGPTQSMITIARALSDRFRFRVVSRAGPGEAPSWTEMAGVERFPLRYDAILPLRLRRIIAGTPHDLLVSNGFFDRRLTIPALLMRRLGLLPKTPFLVAPRGEFSPGALAIRPGRKRGYIALARRLDLLAGVHVQATGELEARDIREVLPNAQSILRGPNIRGVEGLPPHRPRDPGEPLRIAFLSRIDTKKNLHVALELVAAADVPLAFDIIGPIVDAAYWARCQSLLAAMPPAVAARYLGPVEPDAVVQTLAGYDLMLFPTAGENYGHAIVDSLLAGTPVLVSDLTPWHGLAEARAGADLPLADQRPWIEWIRRFAGLAPAELEQWRAGARAFVEEALSSEADSEEVAKCFLEAMENPDSRPA